MTSIVAHPYARRGGRRSENDGHRNRNDRDATADAGRRKPRAPASVSDLTREAKAQTVVMEQLLQTADPWDKEVDIQRRRIRSTYKNILFGHSTSSGAQSIDYLWIYTTHIVIARYRAQIASLDRELAAQGGRESRAGRNGNDRNSRANAQARATGPTEIRKILARFKGFLCSEQTFYRGMITTFVETFGLGRLVDENGSSAPAIDIDVEAYLDAVGIPSAWRDETQDSQDFVRPARQIHLSHDESLKKVGLIHKALVCLGDLERYKEQYGSERDKIYRQRGRRTSNRPTVHTKEDEETGESYAKAKKYYEVARGLLPDNGNPSNQMAVISTYSKDTFTAVYQYYRALACQQPFLTARGNLDKMLLKTLKEWRTARGTLEGDDIEIESARGFPELDSHKPLESLKDEEVLLQAILLTGDSTPSFEKLVADHATHLGRLLAERVIPAEMIVKTIVMAIACHWDIRMRDVQAGGDNDDLEGASLWYLFNISGVMLDVAHQEVKDCLGPQRLATLESMQVIDSPIDEAQSEISLSAMYPSITAVLRRLLPALRIFSKWLKANASILDDDTLLQQEEFWMTYSGFCRHLEALFPFHQLPELVHPLEEDFDMRGFSPLKRGMVESKKSTGIEGTADEQMATHQANEVHPNEEQLMRISDILCDGKLIASQAPIAFYGQINLAERVFQTNDMRAAMEYIDEPHRSFENLQVQSNSVLHTTYHGGQMQVDESDFGDNASMSTATEDDPVNLAMRATMADGLSVTDDDARSSIATADEDDEGDSEEEIMWPTRQNRASLDHSAERAAQATPTFRGNPSSVTPPQQNIASQARAQDLLHTLMTSSPAAQSNTQIGGAVINARTTSPPFTTTASPLLFGGSGFPAGGSIWTRGVNETDGEIERTRSGSGFARAGSMSGAHGLYGWNMGTPVQHPASAFQSPALAPIGSTFANFPPAPGSKPHVRTAGFHSQAHNYDQSYPSFG